MHEFTLQVSPGQLEGPNQRTPAFLLGGKASSSSTHQGTGWSFDASSRLLSMPDVAIVGPPGKLSLDISGGTGSGGHPLQAGTIQAQLTLGDLATDRLGVTNWPSGTHLNTRSRLQHNHMMTLSKCQHSLW